MAFYLADSRPQRTSFVLLIRSRLAAITVAPVRTAASASANAQAPAHCDDENHTDDEVDDLDYFVECRHRTLEKVDERGNDETRYEGREQGPEMASVKEAGPGPVCAIVGLRVTHADNHSLSLPVAPIVKVAATVADVSSQISAIESKVFSVLSSFTLVAPADVAADLTPV